LGRVSCISARHIRVSIMPYVATLALPHSSGSVREQVDRSSRNSRWAWNGHDLGKRIVTAAVASQALSRDRLGIHQQRLADWRRRHARLCPERGRWAAAKGLRLDPNGAVSRRGRPHLPRVGGEDATGQSDDPDLMDLPAEAFAQNGLI
jgi:hypothetical protein